MASCSVVIQKGQESTDMLITVFTPTYNRAHLLTRLYESLCRQTYKDFEWLIVDDGSSDETRSIAQSFCQEDGYFPTIRYYYQENGGKHRAINRGVKEARGELFFIADSDDMLPNDALETVANVYEGVRGDGQFAGACGLDGTLDGKVIGSGLPKDQIDDTSIALRFQYGVTGDMKEVFRTDVLKEFPFPEINGERFCPEMLVWNRIASKYKLRFINQVVYLAEYQDDGITSKIVKARMQSPVSSMMTYQELIMFHKVPLKAKIRAAINYWRFRFCYKASSSCRTGEASIPKLAWWWGLVAPLAYLLHLKDIRQFSTGKR